MNPLTSLDHLVGDGEHSRRHLDVQCSRRLQVYDELEFGRLQHRQFGWLLILEDSAGIVTDFSGRELGRAFPGAETRTGGLVTVIDYSSSFSPVLRR